MFSLQPFRELTGYKGAMLTDESRELYKAMGLYERACTQRAVLKKRTKIQFHGLSQVFGWISHTLFLAASLHVKSNFFTGVLKSTWRGMKYSESQGDMNQQGGAFILGPGKPSIFSKLVTFLTSEVC